MWKDDASAYLKDNPNNLWFKAKLYGWGWTPVKWQGWVTILLYIAGVFLFSLTIDETSPAREVAFTFILPTLFLTTLLLRICYAKGEKPGWKWGPPKNKS